MALKGDIDLTENMDFRKDRQLITKDESAILFNKKSTRRDPYNYDTSSLSIVSTPYTVSIQYGDGNSYSLGISAVDINNWYTTDISNWHTTVSNTNTYTSYSYTITYESPYLNRTDNIVYNTLDNTTSFQFAWPVLSSNKPHSNSNIKWQKHKKSEKIHYATKCCLECGKLHIGNNRECDRIRSHKNKFSRFNLSVKNIRYPWDDKDSLKLTWEEVNDKSLNLLRNKSKIKFKNANSERKIPWLERLNHWMYNDYISDLFKDNDYSKYLTDTSWLRLH